jgi:hypothetical protein
MSRGQRCGLFVSMLVVVSVPLGCGGGGGSASSGIDPARQVGSLDDTERATLCDWTNGLLGGYDHTIACGPSLNRMSDSSQMECTQRLAVFTACTFTVREYETCARSIAATVCEPNPGGETPECWDYETCIGP